MTRAEQRRGCSALWQQVQHDGRSVWPQALLTHYFLMPLLGVKS
jgi:hypothetical protein